MKISRRDWNEYSEMLAELSRLASDEMQTFLESHGIGNTELIVDVAHALVTKYGEASAAAACNLYDEIAEKQGKAVRPAEPAEIASREKTAGAVYGSLKDSSEGKKLKQVPDRLVKQAAADTMLQNAKRDGAEWAWIPSGDGCAMCMTIASRGWLPASSAQLSGGHASHIHANCKCQFAIRFDKNLSVEGYDPDELKRQYDAAEGSGSRQKINYLRRKQYEKEHKLNQHKRKDKVAITDVAISKVRVVKPEGYTDEEALEMQKLNKKVLEIARAENNSNEVLCLMKDGEVTDKYTLGDNNSVTIEQNPDVSATLRRSYPRSIVLAHNHPNLSYFSFDDICTFVQYPSIKTMTIVTNQGKVWHITKKDNFADGQAIDMVNYIASRSGITHDEAVEESIKALYTQIERSK